MSKTWLVLDATNVAWIQYHALKYASLRHDGGATGLLFGFLRAIVHLQKRLGSLNIVFCFDSSKYFRKNIYPNYKESRYKPIKPREELEQLSVAKKQIKALRDEYLTEVGFRNVLCVEGYEADDLVASICYDIQGDDGAIIVSTDQDMYQLLSDKVSVWNPRMQAMITENEFTKTYGIPPSKWIEVKSLAGCASDDVFGVPGIGVTKALKYLKNEMKMESKAMKAIEAGGDIIRRNRKLVALPYEGCPSFTLRKDEVTQASWRALLEKLGIKTIGDLVPMIQI